MTKSKDTVRITACPTCGSKEIRRVTRDISGIFKGQAYTAKKVAFEECPSCGERLYGPSAMQKINTAKNAHAPTRPIPRPLKHRISA